MLLHLTDYTSDHQAQAYTSLHVGGQNCREHVARLRDLEGPLLGQNARVDARDAEPVVGDGLVGHHVHVQKRLAQGVDHGHADDCVAAAPDADHLAVERDGGGAASACNRGTTSHAGSWA